MADPIEAKQTQLEIAERLQLKWLKRMEALLDDATITSTDLATLNRFLMANGWTLDPSKLPKNLRDKMTSHVSPEDLDEEDEAAVVGKIA